MRIHRFGADVGVPVDRFGSDFRVTPLTAHLACLHLPPGGRVGRHEAVSDQLFCVVSGRGWVAGDDGDVRAIADGEAAAWRAGEAHEAGTEEGLVAVVLEGSFEVLALMVVGGPIVVADPDPAWPEWFRRIEAFVAPAVAGVAVRIDHVGSTSVPGLAAEPIIDVDVVVATPDDVPSAIAGLRTIGYVRRGDLGVVGREAFRLTDDPGLPRHHLYLVVDGSPAHLDHVRLRDRLRRDPEVLRRYADLKRATAAKVGGDMDAYLAAKRDLIQELLR